MRKFLLGAAVVLALSSGAAVTGAAPAQAAGVTFDFGNVAIGLNDGYYDNSHNFHRWRSQRDAAQWRREHYSRYYGWRHDDRRYRDYRYHY